MQRADVGRFGIIDEGDAIDFGHDFAAVRRQFIILERLGRLFERQAEHPTNRERSHQAFGVVRPANPAVFQVEQWAGPIFEPTDDHAAIEK